MNRSIKLNLIKFQIFFPGNCTYNTTGNFTTYDKHTFNYNLTGSCPHVLTKDCSPNKRFTVLVQNTPTSNNLVRTTPIVTIYIDNHKVELVTRTNKEVFVKVIILSPILYYSNLKLQRKNKTKQKLHSKPCFLQANKYIFFKSFL